MQACTEHRGIASHPWAPYLSCHFQTSPPPGTEITEQLKANSEKFTYVLKSPLLDDVMLHSILPNTDNFASSNNLQQKL